jgi:hypothetical protein
VAFGDKLTHHHFTIDEVFGATKTDKTDFQACLSKRGCSLRIPLTAVRLLAIAALLCPILSAAEVCPPGKLYESGGEPGTVVWRSYQAEPRPGKFCVATQLHNESKAALQIGLPEAGIERASLRGELQMAECCFDGVTTSKATLHFDGRSLSLNMKHSAEEGLANHEEGYPDLIEEDARVRTASIRGTLTADGRDVRVDITLKCTASKFAKQYAYQYSITDRSVDPVDIAWDLVDAMRKHVTPSVQDVPGGKTYLFLSDAAPKEAEGRIEVRSRSGAVAAVFRLDGFLFSPKTP